MKSLPIFLKFIHWGIILNFIFQVIYAAYMVFFVVKPLGQAGPLGSKVLELDFEFVVTRRLYAIEFWIAFVGLALYLAITEIYPRAKNSD